MACDALDRAVVMLSEMGRFAIAAKHLQTIGDIYEKDLANIEKAIESNERVSHSIYLCLYLPTWMAVVLPISFLVYALRS